MAKTTHTYTLVLPGGSADITVDMELSELVDEISRQRWILMPSGQAVQVTAITAIVERKEVLDLGGKHEAD